MTRAQREPGSILAVIGARAVLLALTWLVFTEGTVSYWPLAVLVVAAATATSVILLPVPVRRWRLRGVLAFVPYFLVQSLLGGLDVSRRALSPSLPLTPRFLVYHLRLRSEVACVFFANVISLLPGSASTLLRDNTLHVHVLDAGLPVARALADLEEHVAALFGLELPEPPA